MRLSQLPYVRQVEYLSPSSLRLLEEEPIRFYLERCGPEETRPPRRPQEFPAAVGSAFDALVKSAATEVLGAPCKPLAELLKNVESVELDRALEFGRQLLSSYSTCGALQQLLLLRPGDFDRRLEGRVPDAVDPVPLRGFLDASIEGGVHDWKVIGANQPGQRSPTAGYAMFFGFDGSCQGPHKRFGDSLELIDDRWAAQMATYGWMLGLTGQIHASIHEVVVGRGVACFLAKISEEFQASLRRRYQKAWAAIQEERVIEVPLAGCGLDYVRTIKEARRW